jgi:hypothetical protein
MRSRDPDDELTGLVRRFLDGRIDFATFHWKYIDRHTRLDRRFLATAAGRRWQEVFGRVCLALPDPVPAGARRAGAIGEAELRRFLAALSLRTS